MVHILIINGPNLNLLGTREPQIYGSESLDEALALAKDRAFSISQSHTIATFQSNHSGAIVDRIQAAKHETNPNVDAIIINPGGLTHYAVVIRDVLLGVQIPFIELHVSNIHAREPWRNHSVLSDKAVGVICGLGIEGYGAAVSFFCRWIEKKQGRAKL